MNGQLQSPEDNKEIRPLCVDLDGSLCCSDTLLDLLVAALVKKPWIGFQLPGWIFRGKAYFKRQLARQVELAEVEFPWNEEVLALINSVPSRPLYLVTGADDRVACEVCKRLPVFEGHLASDGQLNLTGKVKAGKLLNKFGHKGFDYVGNDRVDIPVWRESGIAYLANSSPSLERELKNAHPDCHILSHRSDPWKAFLQSMRPHQWVKNFLVWVPLITAHRLSDPSAHYLTTALFFLFCIGASGFYLFNDLLDMQADRRHGHKQHRPLASGRLSPKWALVGSGFLSLSAMTLAWFLDPSVFILLGLYLLSNGAYSVWIKTIPIFDVFTLAALYALRIVAGAAVIQVELSTWLLAFSVFVFLGLGFAKRYTELLEAKLDSHRNINRRGYKKADLPFLLGMGMGSSFAAVLVFSLYVNSDTAQTLYQQPALLWGAVPVLLFGLSRLWLFACRGELHHDPVLFAVRDPINYLLIGLIACFFLLASSAGTTLFTYFFTTA